jgi:hypothetical protein
MKSGGNVVKMSLGELWIKDRTSCEVFKEENGILETEKAELLQNPTLAKSTKTSFADFFLLLIHSALSNSLIDLH